MIEDKAHKYTQKDNSNDRVESNDWKNGLSELCAYMNVFNFVTMYVCTYNIETK